MQKFLIILVIFVLNTAIEVQSFSNVILNGQNAQEGQFPYQASIFVKDVTNTYICSGSIISHRYLLSSVYCFININNVSEVYAVIK